jgi:hypothetical protein
MKRYSLKFWIIFWLISIIFLISWFFYCEARNDNRYKALAGLGESVLIDHGQTKTYLVLLQNNLELRPGGGFLGAFAAVKIMDGRIVSMETQDLSNFDNNIPNTLEPPYPMKEIGYADFWKMRDSNFSPDFATNAQKALNFYYLGGGKEHFDGVIGITANTLTSMLKVTGPIQIEGYPGKYDSDNAVIALEYQVEQAFEEQGIEKGDRKNVISLLGQEIENRVMGFSLNQKIELAKIMLGDLDRKDIQLYFADPQLENYVQDAGWAGSLNQDWNGDYLMAVDANLGAFKSDYYIKRSLDYTVDLSKTNPMADLKITYQHTANQKDWMTRDYLTYLRVYVPAGSMLNSNMNFDNALAESEFGKTYFGAIVKVPIGTTRTVELNYTLPPNISSEKYGLDIQKQAGINGEPVLVHIINKNGSRKDYVYTMNEDINITQK